MDKNTGNYSNYIRFETEVYHAVYWIPINTLGASRYSNEEMVKISQMPLDKKRERIGNLYEAIQLFQVSGFRGTFDNKDHWFGNTLWQTHKNPEESVLSNEGCCATDTNWLAYFIKDKYDSVGSFCYANPDGNGHITTYIKQNYEYYFIDMMMCRKDSQIFLCQENGVLSDLIDSEWSGFLYRCSNPVDFCLFNIDRFKAKKRSVPFCFYLRESNFVTATGVRTDGKGVEFYIPKTDSPRMLYTQDDKNCAVTFVDLPDGLLL